MPKVIVVLSGGMDSSVLLHHHLAARDEVIALSVDYGQRHRKELDYAAKLCSRLTVEHHIVDLSSVGKLFKSSSLTNPQVQVPHGHYAEENMKVTVVPNRNMILLSLAIGLAVDRKADYVSYAAHAGDHAIYPDCREEFVAAMAEVAQLCDWHKVGLLRPFVDRTKADLVTLGAKLDVDFRFTWSCYEGQGQHCGRCGTCVERREAFYLASVHDPTVYLPSAPPISDLIANGWKPAS